MSASTPFSQIERVLKECAPGYTIRLATHSRVIHFKGKLFRTLPKHDPVENGYVRKLFRTLGITSCAAKLLPGVIKDESACEPPIPHDKPGTPEKAQKKYK